MVSLLFPYFISAMEQEHVGWIQRGKLLDMLNSVNNLDKVIT